MIMPLESTWEQFESNQMGSNPNALWDHHMKSHDQAPHEVTRCKDKTRLHGYHGHYIWAVTQSQATNLAKTKQMS